MTWDPVAANPGAQRVGWIRSGAGIRHSWEGARLLSRTTDRRRLWRLAALTPALALAATGLAAVGQGTNVPAAGAAPKAGADAGTSDYYINYAAPQAEPDTHKDAQLKKGKHKLAPAVAEAHEIDRKYAGGNPKAARQLARLEQRAISGGVSVAQIKQAPETQTAKLLTLLVEFNENANDDFSGTMVPKTVFEDRICVPGAKSVNGPLHNNIPNPANNEHEDNNSFWVPDFSPEHFDKMLYSKEGITERVRKDRRGPDGKMGIDISGFTMRNMYLEMSKGAYTVDGEASNWVKVPHSEGWYGADRCHQDEEGNWVAGPEQTMAGHPDNPAGPGQLAVDAVTAFAEQQPDFDLADYDIEDQFDRDGDGEYFESDGYVDHLVLVHAGEDKSGGGGAEGTYAIWAHSSAVPGGVEVPGTGIKIENYIVQPEDSGVGVFAHEYGHDLGLPDLYDTTGAGESDVDFWDLMSSGSHSGPVFQSMPTHMGLWDKFVLGWADPLVLEPGDAARKVKLGQTSRTPVGTEDGIRVNLPNKVITLAEPHSGEKMWWTGNDQDWADNKIAREVEVPAAGDVRFWMWNDYTIEADWDYGFVEVSTDGGKTWAEQKVYAEDGTLVSTDDDYADPNNRLKDYGNKKYGLTGSTDGWRHHFIDLSSFAGTTVQVRLRYATDAAFVERGWFADDFAVTADDEVVWSDDVESGDSGWTAEVGSFTSTTGEGWRIDTGTAERAHYYLAEWRNYDGFDKGLRWAYDTTYSRDGAWKVRRLRYNAPGMLVWYRDTTYGNQNNVTATTFDLPSVGTKGGLLIVDSHYNPYRREKEAAIKDPSELDNLPSRPQSSNAAFGLVPTKNFTECFEAPDEPFSEYCSSFGKRAPKPGFSDDRSYYPGIEYRPDLDEENPLFFRDQDASVVLPNRGNDPYSVRIVDKRGHLIKDLFGLDLGGNIVLGNGRPDQPFGVKLRVDSAGRGNTYANVWVQPAK